MHVGYAFAADSNDFNLLGAGVFKKIFLKKGLYFWNKNFLKNASRHDGRTEGTGGTKKNIYNHVRNIIIYNTRTLYSMTLNEKTNGWHFLHINYQTLNLFANEKLYPFFFQSCHTHTGKHTHKDAQNINFPKSNISQQHAIRQLKLLVFPMPSHSFQCVCVCVLEVKRLSQTLQTPPSNRLVKRTSHMSYII